MGGTLLPSHQAMELSIESEREDDGRWLAEVLRLPGCRACGTTRDEALSRAQARTLRVLADCVEHGETRAEPITISIAA